MPNLDPIPWSDLLETRIQRLNAAGRPLRDYHLAQAQCWVDASRHELSRNDRGNFVRQALAETERLLAAMESGASPEGASPWMTQARRLRPDLWSRAAAVKSHPGARCAAEKLACAEVRLVHGAHELPQQQWRHAQPYVQMAEDLIADAEALAGTCSAALPFLPTSADSPTARVQSP